jgi:hypothetical protein
LFQGKPADFMIELAQTKEFLEATDHKIATRRMLDRDFANRFLGFYLLGYENYQPDLDTYMSKAMAMINNPDTDADKIKHDFKEAMILSKRIFGREAFRKVYHDYKVLPPINKALFDAISVQFALLSEEERNVLKECKDDFKKELKESLHNDAQFFISVTSSTGDKNRVQYRHSKVKELIEKFTIKKQQP